MEKMRSPIQKLIEIVNSYPGQIFRSLVGLRRLEESSQETVDGWRSNIKRQYLEDEMFHSQHLLGCVGVVCDVDKLRHLRWVDLFKFTG